MKLWFNIENVQPIPGYFRWIGERFFFVFKARNRNGRRKLCGEKWRERGGDVTKMNQCWINTATCILFSYRKWIKALNWNQSANESVRRPAVVRVTNVECAWVCITCEIYCTIVLISTWLSLLLLLLVSAWDVIGSSFLPLSLLCL